MRIALLSLEKDGHPHSPRYAEGGDASFRAPAAHFVEERRRDPGAGGADRVAERDRSAVDVDAAEVEGEIARAGNDLGGEGLVELDEVDVGQAELRPGEQSADRRHGADAHPRRVDSRRGPR